MRIALIGADHEENLGVAMIAAALREARHRVDVVPFNEWAELDGVVARVLEKRPGLVGLAIQFQHRSSEFLLVARRLREAGYSGHITCGGQHPTLAFDPILRGNSAIDSVVLHEGEHSLVELAAALAHRRSLELIAGLALRDLEGNPRRTPSRRLCDNLDDLPFAYRYRSPTRHFGLPFIPVWGSRGCWGACSFCAITTYYRDARAQGGGRQLRLRSVNNLAKEMAGLWHEQGGPCLFCFHDDTLLLPRPADSVERLRSLRRELDLLGVGKLGIVGKCRPDSVTPELALELRQLGVIRMFVGIENGSQRGQDHLNRKTHTAELEAALTAFERAGIFTCYNLLVFEPDATLDDVGENIEFMRRHPRIPVNFCRAEPYHGTPLYQLLGSREALFGCYLGWDYQIADPRTELLFRMCAAAFRERNFGTRGVANRLMGAGYLAQIMRSFFDTSSPHAQRLQSRASQLIEDITLNTASLFADALEFVRKVPLSDREGIERKTAHLGLRISAHDQVWQTALDELVEEMEAFTSAEYRRLHPPALSARWKGAWQQVAVAGCMVSALQSCTEEGAVVDYAPAPGGISGDMSGGAGGALPRAGSGGGLSGAGGRAPQGGAGNLSSGNGGTSPEGGTGNQFQGMGGSAGNGGSAGSGGSAGIGGNQPLTGGRTSSADISEVTTRIAFATVDPPPPDAGATLDPSPAVRADGLSWSGDRRPVVDHWQDTAPRRAVRSRELPLFDPPVISLVATSQGHSVKVRLESTEPQLSYRWESQGEVQGDGSDVLWTPQSTDDQLRVAVRSGGGVAVSTLRAKDLA